MQSTRSGAARRKILTAAIFLLMVQFPLVDADATLPTTTILIPPDIRIKAEIASDEASRERGLMFRKALPEDEGMLFVFPTLDYQGFWMKNTLIPLDMIWLNERKEIVYFVTAIPCKKDPCDSYIPMQKALYVLEVHAGFVKKHRLALGQQLAFEVTAEIKS